MFKLIQTIGLFILSGVVLVACTMNDLDKYEIKDKEVVYNSEIHTLEYIGDLEDVSVVYENNIHTEVGVYEVKAIFSLGDEIKESTAILTIIPYTITYDDLNLVEVYLYNSKAQQLIFDTLENINYEFTNKQDYIEVGVYNNTLIINSNNKNYNSTQIDISFEIIENYELILDNTTIENYEVEFNYDYHSILLENHDELIQYGFEIHYYYDNIEYFPIEAGIYDVYITIEKEELYKELHSELTINKRQLEATIISDDIIETNGSYNFEVIVDSNYVDVEYRYYDSIGNQIDKPTTIGSFYVEVVLLPHHNNYEVKNSVKHFEVVLCKEDKNLLYTSELNDLEVIYNDDYYSLLLNKHNVLLDRDFVLTYSFNMFKEVGEYEVSVVIEKFGYKRKLNALLTINPLELTSYFIELNIKEGQYYNLTLNDTYNTEVEYKYFNELNEEIGKPSLYGSYYIKAIFNNTNDNIIINDVVYQFNINLSDYDQLLIDNASLYDKEVEYNGRYQYLSVSNSSELSMSRYTINYTYNNNHTPPIDEGVYEVVAHIIKNNIIVKTITATLYII